MSINKLISIKNPIVDAMIELDVDHEKLMPKFTLWAVRAEQQIGSYYQYERHKEVLNITDCVAILPNNCVLIEAAILGSHIDNCDSLINRCLGNLNNVTNFGSNGMFLAIDISSSTNTNPGYGYVNFSIQNGKLLFNNSGMCGSQVTIQYLRIKEDCDGFPEVSVNHVLAIKEYIVYMYYKNGKDYLALRKAQTAFQEWNRLCAHARAEDAQMTPPGRQAMVGLYHNAWSGHGMWQGMNTTLGVNGYVW